jgi:hypothetical protein
VAYCAERTWLHCLTVNFQNALLKHWQLSSNLTKTTEFFGGQQAYFFSLFAPHIWSQPINYLQHCCDSFRLPAGWLTLQHNLRGRSHPKLLDWFMSLRRCPGDEDPLPLEVSLLQVLRAELTHPVPVTL